MTRFGLGVAQTIFRKRAHRQPINANAWIRPTGSFGVRECRVIDISRTGAKLEVENTDNIPDKLLLLFSRSDAGNQVTVVWRRGTQVGVEFSSANPPRPHA
jgi:hypothetical protein